MKYQDIDGIVAWRTVKDGDPDASKCCLEKNKGKCDAGYIYEQGREKCNIGN